MSLSRLEREEFRPCSGRGQPTARPTGSERDSSDLESEEKDLIAAVAESEGVHQMLTDEVANLRRIFRALPVGMDDGERMELAAASLGVQNFSGSSIETPGLYGLSAKKAASGPATMESLAPVLGAPATVIVEPPVVPAERVTEVVIPAPGDAPEDDGSVPSVRVDTEMSEQVFVEDVEASEQVLAEDATDEAAGQDGMEVEKTV
ncbi:unnamed protein product [Arabis nemorensis]|uniref:Uncharacterized protein n=1 Tax=Arabis nemorensis TaxID=586526 RepID=A0A565B049_9BRAS|nr:unnamed protein product [Arabis nemorensis]